MPTCSNIDDWSTNKVDISLIKIVLDSMSDWTVAIPTFLVLVTFLIKSLLLRCLIGYVCNHEIDEGGQFVHQNSNEDSNDGGRNCSTFLDARRSIVASILFHPVSDRYSHCDYHNYKPGVLANCWWTTRLATLGLHWLPPSTLSSWMNRHTRHPVPNCWDSATSVPESALLFCWSAQISPVHKISPLVHACSCWPLICGSDSSC